MSLKESNDHANSYEGHFDHDPEQHREGEGFDAEAPLTLRALVSTKEAGVIIGKGGKNVADLRDQTGVKAGVSKVIQGVHDRILTVTGTVEGVAKAFELIAKTLLDNPITSSPPGTPLNPLRASMSQTTSIRLLISHNLMGSIIGRQGMKIKYIQDTSSARMVASKDMLPQSTERVVEVQGSVEAIRAAIEEIGKCLVDDWDRGVGTVLYNPTGPRAPGTGGNSYNAGPSTTGTRNSNSSHSGNNNNYSRTGHGSDFAPRRNEAFGGGGGGGGGHNNNGNNNNNSSSSSSNNSGGGGNSNTNNSNNGANLRTQEISIPADMVGCIIGKGGTKISEIRRLSGSRISIAKTPHDETGERMFTIVGTSESNEKALYLLYGQLEVEKDKRLNMAGDHIAELDEDES